METPRVSQRPDAASGARADRSRGRSAAHDAGRGRDLRPGQRRSRILVVDDEEANRTILAAQVRAMGHVPVLAASGEEALALLGPGVDLVLLDVMMPRMDGYQVARAMRAGDTAPDVPIIMVTALDGRGDRLRAVEAGANDFITKPVERIELKIRMGGLLRLRESRARLARSRAELRETVDALERSRNELEFRVRERTTELVRAYEGLQEESRRRRNAQAELQLLEELFRHSPQGIMITDGRLSIQRVNPAFTSITGFEIDEVLGGRPCFLDSEHHDEAFHRAMWESVERDGRWSGETWNRRKSGEPYAQWLDLVAIEDGGGVAHYLGIFSDITHAKVQEELIHHHSLHDSLTGLPNRILFADRLRKAMASARRSGTRVVVAAMDVDNFKQVNESLGHAEGDRVLQAVASRLSGHLRGEDTVGRLGGDEFVALLEVLDRDRIMGVPRRLAQAFRAPFEGGNAELSLTASIGLTVFPDDGDDPAVLIKNASLALDGVKVQGRDSHRFFTEAMNASAGRRLELERSLRRALRRKEFEVHFQPKVDVPTGRVCGMEALARWRTPEGEIVPPDEFIPLAEDTGLVIPLGRLMLEMACRQAKTWLRPGAEHLRVSVNLSPRQFRQDDLVPMVRDVLKRSGLPAANLELEITETSLMADVEQAKARLNELVALGVTLSIDDFGTGYSSLNYLKHFPIHVLKIDKSFVQDLGADEGDARIVATIIALARNFNLEVVAEGVEDEIQAGFLSDHGCRVAQGFLYGRPMCGSDFGAWLADRCTLPSANDSGLEAREQGE